MGAEYPMYGVRKWHQRSLTHFVRMKDEYYRSRQSERMIMYCITNSTNTREAWIPTHTVHVTCTALATSKLGSSTCTVRNNLRVGVAQELQ